MKTHGLNYLYPEDIFYQTHKISRVDFLNKLDNAATVEEKEQLILSLYDDEAVQGRRGTLSVKESVKVINK